MHLKDKVAIITGSGGGIGRAAAILFAREGAKVTVNEWELNEKGGKETVEQIKDLGGDAVFVKGDISKTADVKRMVNTTIDSFGKIDVLYNNAAVCLFGPPVRPHPLGQDAAAVDLSEEIWDLVIKINLTGTFLCCKYSIPEMIKSSGGSIINTSSAAALVGVPNQDGYNASKGGVISLTKSLAVEYAQQNIRVNAICPGGIKTPMTAGFFEDRETLKLIEDSHLTALGEPEDIAHFALYLASDESRFCTGTIHSIDGGYTTR